MQQTRNNALIKTREQSAGRMRFIVYCLFGIMFFFAISSTMVGILVPEIISAYDLTNTQIGIIGSVQSAGSIAAMVFGGILSDRFPKLRLIMISFVAYTAILFGIGMAPAYKMLLALFLGLGIANSYLNLLISAFISEAYGERRTTYLNMVHAFFSMGSLAGPAYASVFLQRGQTWNQSFMALGLLCSIVILIFITIAIPVKEKGGAAKSKQLMKDVYKLLTDKHILMLSLLSSAYMGHQAAVGLWIAAYMQDGLGLSQTMGSASLTLFWAGIVIGRLMQPVIAKKIKYERWLSCCCCISAILYAGAFALESGSLLMLVLFLVGSLTGAAYPSIIAMACSRFPNLSGTATSALSLINALIGAVLSAMIGMLVDAGGFVIGMMMIPVLMFLCTIILAFYQRLTE